MSNTKLCYVTVRRIEADFRSAVRAAVKSSSAITRRELKSSDASSSKPSSTNPTSKKSSTDGPPSTEAEAEPKTKAAAVGRDPRARKTEFDVLPTKTRLNDIALAPPTLSRAARKAPEKASGSAASLGLTMAQKAAMEVERETVIRRYRELKEAKRAEMSVNSEKK